MGIGLSGMVSGLDTESIVEAMVSGQTAKKTKIENKITMNKWTTESWSSLNKKIYSFYTGYASKLRLKSAYQTKSAESSDESKVKVTSTKDGAVGQHSIQIKSLASSQYVTGAKLAGTYTAETRIQQLDAENNSDLVGQTITFTGKSDTGEAAASSITIDNNTKISDIIASAKEAGITASYDTAQKRFFFSSADSGTENKFTITSIKNTSAYTSALSNLNGILTEEEQGTLSETDLTSYQNALSALTEANTDDLTAVLDNFDTFDVTDTANTEDKIAIYDAINTIADLRTEIDANSNDEIAALDPDSETYADDVAAVKAEIRANNLADIKSTVSDYKISLANKTESGSLIGLGLGSGIDGTAIKENGTGSLVVVAASDAEAVVDGATMTSSSNTLVVNGLTLNMNDTTYNKTTGEYDTVNVTVSKNTESTYKLIKEALTSYNELVDEMSTLYYADSARDYDPLTDEQKEAMTDDEIEQWESKIKSALLRRDTTLGSLMSSMRTSLQSSYKDEDGNSYSLSTYGIVTGAYTEYGKLHIYGDSEDSTYATYDDRLQAALDEDPDKVMDALSSIFTNLYTTLSDKCAKTSISSALTFYNDKQYSTYLTSYQEDLEEIEDRITELSDRYYEQFTAMEKALSNLQSQTSSLSSLFGTSSS